MVAGTEMYMVRIPTALGDWMRRIFEEFGCHGSEEEFFETGLAAILRQADPKPLGTAEDQLVYVEGVLRPANSLTVEERAGVAWTMEQWAESLLSDAAALRNNGG